MVCRARRHGSACLAAALVALFVPLPANAQSCPDADALTAGFQGAMAHVRFLADDLLEGRAVATPGERCAADYLVEHFLAIGLEPAGHDGTWFHTFPVRTGSTLGSDNAISLAADPPVLHADWAPHGFSASGSVRAELVYGGYGVSRPGHPDDAFTRADVRGRVVVVEAGDPDSPGSRSVRADPHFKATIASRRGAAGVVVLLAEGATLPDISGESRASLPVPVVAVAGTRAELLRAAAREQARIELRTDVVPVEVAARNVVARLPGAPGPLAAEHVVVGAHYDHLGLGGEGSLDPSGQRVVHNGADDNASGTGALVEIARALAAGPPPDRSVLFIAFTGEEQGLWGSARFVADPTIDLERAVAMVNLDMVGRLDGGPLTVFGTGTAEEWGVLLDEANATLADPLDIARVPVGSGPSDHASFHAAGIPVLHFFTNSHADYHRPSDEWQQIDAAGLDRVIELATAVTTRLGQARTILTPAAPTPPAPTPR
jgi:hypothetical protein